MQCELRTGEKVVPRRRGQVFRVEGIPVRLADVDGDRILLVFPDDAEVVKVEEEELALLAMDA